MSRDYFTASQRHYSASVSSMSMVASDDGAGRSTPLTRTMDTSSFASTYHSTKPGPPSLSFLLSFSLYLSLFLSLFLRLTPLLTDTAYASSPPSRRSFYLDFPVETRLPVDSHRATTRHERKVIVTRSCRDLSRDDIRTNSPVISTRARTELTSNRAAVSVFQRILRSGRGGGVDRAQWWDEWRAQSPECVCVGVVTTTATIFVMTTTKDDGHDHDHDHDKKLHVKHERGRGCFGFCESTDFLGVYVRDVPLFLPFSLYTVYL